MCLFWERVSATGRENFFMTSLRDKNVSESALWILTVLWDWEPGSAFSYKPHAGFKAFPPGVKYSQRWDWINIPIYNSNQMPQFAFWKPLPGTAACALQHSALLTVFPSSKKFEKKYVRMNFSALIWYPPGVGWPWVTARCPPDPLPSTSSHQDRGIKQDGKHAAWEKDSLVSN